jgi:hypothetical protein
VERQQKPLILETRHNEIWHLTNNFNRWCMRGSGASTGAAVVFRGALSAPRASAGSSKEITPEGMRRHSINTMKQPAQKIIPARVPKQCVVAILKGRAEST